MYDVVIACGKCGKLITSWVIDHLPKALPFSYEKCPICKDNNFVYLEIKKQ
ncbi:hypothetical protein LCGC14_0566880 [marine sediment metagenome]|uniref:Uncharacterized protein n=1 Tax=marine sediment metagenome TaxID=412755 RepID=A0A0F9U6N9_9ZZZZ